MNKPPSNTKRPHTSMLWMLSAGSLFISIFVSQLFMCLCGHLDRIALTVTVPAAILAWYPFLRDRRARSMTRIVEMIAVVLATLIMFKNVADMLWFGHSPVFE